MIDFQLYVIVDRGLLGERSLTGVAEDLVAGGAEIIQYRDKISSLAEIMANCKLLKRITDVAGIPLIVNDYPQIVLEIDAAGVHLGQEDMAVNEARGLLGKEKLIGLSTHSLKQALEAQQLRIDYIGIGPIFATSTKSDLAPIGIETLSRVAVQVKVPTVAIGGINLDNIDQVLISGIKHVAVASAILQSSSIKNSLREFLSKIRD